MYDTELIAQSTGIVSIIYSKSIDSTNRLAVSLANKGKTDFAVIADEQTEGRGRFDRKWESETGGIYITVCRSIDDYLIQPQLFSICAAMAVIRTAAECSLKNTEYRWPNDVLIGGRKISGILAELAGSKIAIGIGLNLNNTFPDDLSGKATSIAIETGRVFDKNDVTIKLLNHLENILREPESVSAFMESSAMIGKTVSIVSGKDRIAGIVKGFSIEGGIIIKSGDTVRTFLAGDVTLLREKA